MWNTTEAGIPNRTGNEEWPTFQSPADTDYDQILAKMKQLAQYDKADDKAPRRSTSNLGHVANDRYGMHQLLQNRKKKLFVRPPSLCDTPAADVEGRFTGLDECGHYRAGPLNIH